VDKPFISLALYRHRFIPDEQGWDACRLGGGPDDCGCPQSHLIHSPLPPYDWGWLAVLAKVLHVRLPRGPRWAFDSVKEATHFRQDIYISLVDASAAEVAKDRLAWT
jgi:hypothetical protein